MRIATVAGGVMLGALVLSSALIAPAWAAGTLCKSCVDANNDTASTPGKSSSDRELAERAINPAVSFIGKDLHLKVAVPFGIGWQIVVVDSLELYASCDMALDEFSQPMIAYRSTLGMLWWTHRMGAIWEREPVDPSAIVMGKPSIVRVPGGVGIAYADQASGLLKYAERIGSGPWQSEFVAPAGSAPETYPSLIADGPARAISFYDSNTGVLQLAEKLPGGWSVMPVDAAANVGGYSSLVGNAAIGLYGIAYYDFTNADLKYAFNAGGTWMIETVDGVGARVGRYCSAVMFANTPSTQVGIAYYDETNGDLKYAQKQGTMWTRTVQDTAGNAGGSITCAATPSPVDTVGFSYVERNAGDLLYQFHGGTLEDVPATGAGTHALAIEWLRSATGAAGRLRFTVPAPGPVRVAFYDAAGRWVATPLRQSLAAGPAEVRWDGTDGSGRRVPAGVLFARVETAGGAGSTRAVILR